MKQFSLGTHTATGLASLTLLLSSACFGPTRGSAGLQQVDGLVTRVEHVQVECELAKESIRETVGAMLEMVAPQGQGTVLEAFAAFEVTIETSERQEQTLAKSVAYLAKSGKSFFAGWNKDLDVFATERMRIQSRNRMEETQGYFDQIMLATQDPLEGYAKFQVAVQDVALFLSRDFNAGSVRSIEGDLRNLIREAGVLQRELDVCLDGTHQYIAFAGLPNRVQVTEEVPTVDPQPVVEDASQQ